MEDSSDSDSDDYLLDCWHSTKDRIDKVPLLREREEWLLWNSEIRFALEVDRFDEFLGDESDQQAEKALPPVELKTWRLYQAAPCSTIQRRLDPFVRESVGEHRTVKELLRAIDDYCKPKEVELFTWHFRLMNRLRSLSLSLSNHKDLREYRNEVHNIRRLYRRIDVELPESVYVSAFIEGLPSSEEWVRNFKMSSSFQTSICTKDAGEDKPLLTLDEAFRRAERLASVYKAWPSGYPKRGQRSRNRKRGNRGNRGRNRS